MQLIPPPGLVAPAATTGSAHRAAIVLALLAPLVLYFGTFAVAAKNLRDMLKTEWADIAWIGLGIIVSFVGMAPFSTGLNQKLPWAAVGISGVHFVSRAVTDRPTRREGRLGVGRH